MFETLIQDSLVALPILSWAIGGILVLFVQIFTQCSRACTIASVLTLVGMLIFGVISFDSGLTQALFMGTVMMDPLTQSLNLIAMGIALAVVLMSAPGLFETSKLYQNSYCQYPEFLIAILFSGFGAAVTVSAVDLSAFFLGIETLSIGLYALCGFFRAETRSTESALKYLLVGGFSTVILLYGISFLYGASGSTNYLEISKVIVVGEKSIVLLGSIFILIGLAFKFALMPFHFYTPDVYEGAPTPVTAYLATIVKVAVVGAGIRLFWGVLDSVSFYWESFWMALCVLSIVVGNIAALQQKTIKKLLAFSSISHAGFLGLGILVAQPGLGDLFPLLTYLIIYCAVTLGIFGLVSWIEDRERVFLLEDLKGLGTRRVAVGILFSIFSLSLAGIPPFAGFMVKFWIFQSLIEQGYLGVALLAVLGSIIGVAYYLKILMLLFMTKDGDEGAAVNWTGFNDRFFSLRVLIFAAALVAVLGGLIPGFYADWILQTIALN